MAGGNIGIGTTTPEQKLEVGGNIIASASGNVSLILRSLSAVSTDGQFTILSASTSDRLDIRRGSGTLAETLMSIASSGNVGIGTTTSGAKLDIETTSAGATRLLTLRVPNAGGNNPQINFAVNAAGSSLDVARIESLYPASNHIELAFSTFNTTLLERMRIAYDGNVGINTTAPAAKLDVAGDLQINISSSSGAANSFALCHTSNGATSDQFVIDCGNAPSADYMEMYPTTPDIEEGEIMVPSSTSFVLDTHNNKVPKLIRSSRPYQQGIIGITSIASQAGDFNAIGYNIQSTNDNPQQTKPLALSGRVLLKVSTDNGPIRVGDRITSSNLPGIGMKATTAGMTVGTALEATTDNLQLTTGDYQKIMVFVGAQYWAPQLTTDNLPLTTPASGSWLSGTFESLFAMIVEAFRSVLGIVFERGKIGADQLCAGTVCVNEQQLQQLLDSSGVTVPPVAETPTPAPSQADESAPTPSETPSESSPTPVPDTPTPIPDIPTPTPDASPPAEPIPTGTP